MIAATCQGSYPTIADLSGVWRRMLLIDSAGNRDDTSDVTWLQAGSCFLDLRRLSKPPSFDPTSGVAGMTANQRAWAMSQQAFAGTLFSDADVFQWQRCIDLHPPGPVPDTGRLRWSADMLVETGLHVDYLEHWARVPTSDEAVWAMWLRDGDGRGALLMRVGDHFGWARDRLPRSCAQTDFFDCEIALGRVGGSAWQITASSLPFRDRDLLAPDLAGDLLVIADRSSDGHSMTRQFQVVGAEGVVQL
jgi:hypothetical protein